MWHAILQLVRSARLIILWLVVHVRCHVLRGLIWPVGSATPARLTVRSAPAPASAPNASTPALFSTTTPVTPLVPHRPTTTARLARPALRPASPAPTQQPIAAVA